MSPAAIERGITITSEAIKALPLRISDFKDHLAEWKKPLTLGAASVGFAILEVACSGQGKVEPISTPGVSATEARPTATARPGGGGLTFEDPRLNELFDKIARSQASEQEIIEYNQGAAASEARANATATAEAQATATAGNTPKEAPTPNPDIKQKITSPEVWATAELIELPPNEQGQTLRYIGLNPKEIGKIFSSPIPGQATKRENPKGFNGNRVTIFQPSNLRFSYTITGDIEFLNPNTETNIPEGHPLAKSRGTDTKNYGYAVLITATEFNDKDQDVTSDAALKELAPYLYTKPSKKVSDINPFTQSGPSKGTPIFLP